MATITKKISNFPSAPDSTNDSPTEFNTKANAFVAHQANTYVAEVNEWATEANAVRDDINNIVASIPIGTIDDINIGTHSVYSSDKMTKTYRTLDKSPLSPELEVHLAGGGVMPIWSGVAYTDSGTVGTNPTAKIYPDGIIIGSTSNGEYIKRPDGTVEIHISTTISTPDSYGSTGLFYKAGGKPLTIPIVLKTIGNCVTSGDSANIFCSTFSVSLSQVYVNIYYMSALTDRQIKTTIFGTWK